MKNRLLYERIGKPNKEKLLMTRRRGASFRELERWEKKTMYNLIPRMHGAQGRRVTETGEEALPKERHKKGRVER